MNKYLTAAAVLIFLIPPSPGVGQLLVDQIPMGRLPKEHLTAVVPAPRILPTWT